MNYVTSLLVSSLAGFSAMRLLACGVVALQCLLAPSVSHAQDNIVGDGFGGRSWYVPAPITMGFEVAAAVGNGGQLYMWGNRFSSYQLLTPPGGYNDATASVACPYAVTGMTNVKMVSLNYALAAVVKNDGTGWFWTGNNPNPDGFSMTAAPYKNTPTQVITGASFVSVGPSHIVFVKADGTVWSLGANTYGAFGNGATNSAFVSTPVQMTGMTSAVRVCAFGANGAGAGSNPDLLKRGGTLVIKSDGTLWAAGGGGTLVAAGSNLNATQITIPSVVDVKAGEHHAVALTATGDVYTWGADYYSVLGQGRGQGGAGNNFTTPSKVTFPAGTPAFVAIESDPATNYGQITYALDAEGKLWAWGYTQGNSGITGTAENDTLRRPVVVARNVADIEYGGSVAYLVRDGSYPADQRLWATFRGSQPRVFALSDEVKSSPGPWNDPPSTNFYTSATISSWTPCRPDNTLCGIPGGLDLTGNSGSYTPMPITDVAIVKTASVTQIVPGTPFTYTLTVTNTGNTANNVIANDKVPTGLTIQGTPTASNGGVVTVTGQNVSATWATMPSGATRTVTITVVK